MTSGDPPRGMMRIVGEWLLKAAGEGDDQTLDHNLPLIVGADLRSSIHPVAPHFVQLMVRDEYRERVRRNKMFPSDLFGEPAWDMLLDAYAAHLAGRRVAVKDMCIASQVPATTALRWIVVLEEQGLISREIDRRDRRRTWMNLTDAALTALENYYASRLLRAREDIAQTIAFGGERAP